jgi:hypothetical protein
MAKMSRTTSKNRKTVPSSAEEPLLQGMRIDPAHQHGGEEDSLQGQTSPEREVADALTMPGEPSVEELPPDLAAEQLRRQGEQLAEYLRSRQRELDHRESQLNAQVAQLEADARTARIWLGERETDIQNRHEAQIALERQCRQRLDRLAAAEASLQRRTAAPENAHLAGNFISPGATAGLSSSDFRTVEQDIFTVGQASSGTRCQLEHKLRELEEAECRTAEAQVEIRRLSDQLLNEREAQREEARGERQRMAAEQRRVMAELDQKRAVLEKRAEHVDRSRAALGDLREELQRLHRETLEIRLATEELWAQLSAAAPPAALTRSLGLIRAQLADRYRAARTEAAEEQKQLASIRGELAEQCEKLAERRQQFERFAAGQRQDAEREAARLIARERELQATESRLLEQSRQGEIERQQYEHEIRRLRLQLLTREGSAKVA